MCLKGEYKNHWLDYNEAITHQLNRMRRGSPAQFWVPVITILAILATALAFMVWLVVHLLKTPFKERGEQED